MKLRHYIVALLLVPLLLLLRFVVEIDDYRPGFYTVTRVIDGDTVVLDGHEKSRLSGIDTPERDEPYYDDAKQLLARLVLHKKVRIESGRRKRDNYSRLLGYMYLDTILVNAEILKQGLGRMYLFPDNRGDTVILEQLYAAQRFAMSKQLGVWSLPIIMEEDQYIGNSRSLRLHRPECQSAAGMSDKNRVIFNSPEEAYHQGYSPCRNCKP